MSSVDNFVPRVILKNMSERSVFIAIAFGLGLVALALFFSLGPGAPSFLRTPGLDNSVAGPINSSISSVKPLPTSDSITVYSAPAPVLSREELAPIEKFLKENKLPAPPQIFAKIRPFSGAVAAPASGIAPSKPLTEQEIFDRIWPPGYREGLKKTEALVIENGVLGGNGGNFLSASSSASQGKPVTWLIPIEKRGDFTTDEEVLMSLMNVAVSAHQQGFITGKEFQAAERAIKEVLPEIVKEERAVLEKRGSGAGILLPRDQKLSDKKNLREIARDLIDGVIYIMLQAKPAYAGWYTSPDCYKDDNENYNVEGFNGWAFCCNCGIKCYGYYCVYVEDCGQNSANCDYPLGCLNLICQSWPNAIWDGFNNPDGTGICGCG